MRQPSLPLVGALAIRQLLLPNHKIHWMSGVA